MFPLRQRTARASIRRRSLVNVPKNPGETKKETYRYTNILRRAGKQRRNVYVTLQEGDIVFLFVLVSLAFLVRGMFMSGQR